MDAAGVPRSADAVALRAGLAGVIGALGYCALDCRCHERRIGIERAMTGLPSIGLRPERVPGPDGARVQGRRRLLFVPDDGTPLTVASVTLDGQPVASGSVWSVRRTGPLDASRPATARSLLCLVADLLSPPVSGDCDRHGRRSVALGLAAFDLWLGDLARAQRMSASRRTHATARATAWGQLLAHAGVFLRIVAGGRRTRWARCVRRAAEAADTTSGCLAEAADLPTRSPVAYGYGRVLRARAAAAEMAQLAADAAFDLAGVDAVLAQELAADAGTGLTHPALLGDLVYLARAGYRPLRVLALRRLADSAEPQARATLREMSHDRDPALAGVAAWALAAQQP
jgi:hypothetical protein